MALSKILLITSLQLFAEGGGGDGGDGAGVTGDAAGPQTGVEGQPSEPDSGAQEEPQQSDLDAEFDELVKGKYKEQFSRRTSDIVRKRVGDDKGNSERLSALEPALAQLSDRYGIDASDSAALAQAILDDDSYYEDEALRRGVTVAEVKSDKARLREEAATKRENEQLKEQIKQQRHQEAIGRVHAQWDAQAAELQQAIPNFDFAAELASNETFARFLRSGATVRQAFMAAHDADIVPGAMQYATQQAASKIANSIASGRSRPSENGMSSQAPVQTGGNVNSLSRAEFRALQQRIANGERISFAR